MFLLGASPALAAHHRVRHHASTVALQGTLNSTETRVFSNPDAGALYTWTGHGTMKPLGSTAATGKNHGVGFIRQGSPTGTMTLTGSRGSISLKVTYDATSGFAALPQHGTYVITAGTGSYAGAKGSGPLLRQQGECQDGTSNGLCPVGASFSVTYQFGPAQTTKGSK
jgi:hypothetical protein